MFLQLPTPFPSCQESRSSHRKVLLGHRDRARQIQGSKPSRNDGKTGTSRGNERWWKQLKPDTWYHFYFFSVGGWEYFIGLLSVFLTLYLHHLANIILTWLPETTFCPWKKTRPLWMSQFGQHNTSQTRCTSHGTAGRSWNTDQCLVRPSQDIPGVAMLEWFADLVCSKDEGFDVPSGND